MLDADTKRRIDTARDILVGKVPDPKSQVEQITIALIYKFMDDIDAEAEEWGGPREFFAGEFARYGWARLMRPGLGGHEVLDLYAEAITRMPENPGIPSLFRDIFNNAYLPYRDPETLRAFLKVIDEFTYDHSERLGDAFEYLLSVLGAQGDAGQFRTPRHIIDFIVAVVDPKKDEMVLDPACGTAGFLISSYKHILAANTDEDGNSTLTPDDRRRLAANFKGYDISPDMVRLSLVNMYLHGFREPHIHEYDTLTSEERWNEYADVILANPPFMSPKGGIRPHNRFSVKSKRSEVLFVDYMAEHLTPSGRAGIIVPEGIIFQSQNAHRQLRKMLVEDYLVAVVSLPAGVFNPYSGVKTSVLILDRALAKRTNHIAFFKVTNDGFDLGAQRRPVDRNDLPQAQAELAECLRRLRSGEPLDDFQPALGLVVVKERVAADGDYGLSAERYRVVEARGRRWKTVTIGQVCQINPKSGEPTALYSESYFNYIDISCVENGTGRFLGADRVETNDAPSRARRLVEPDDVLVSTVRPNLRAFTILSEVPERAVASTGFAVLRPKTQLLLPDFLINLIRGDAVVAQMIGMMGRGSYPSINQTDVASIQIPLPPLEVQQEIVAEIEGYQKVIDGARAVVSNYRPHIVVDPEWPMVCLEAIADVTSSKRILAEEYVPTGIPFYRTKEIVELSNGDGISSEFFISHDRFESLRSKYGAPYEGDILISAVGTIGTSWVVSGERDFYFKDGNLLWMRNLSNADPRYVKFCLDAVFSRGVDNVVFGAAYKALTIVRLKKLQIPLPTLNAQRAIVAQIEAEQTLVDANRELVKRMEGKITAAVERVWDR